MGTKENTSKLVAGKSVGRKSQKYRFQSSPGCTKEPGLLWYVLVLCSYVTQSSIPQKSSTGYNAHIWTGTVPLSGGTKPTQDTVEREELLPLSLLENIIPSSLLQQHRVAATREVPV
jgi:hypothetical protein